MSDDMIKAMAEYALEIDEIRAILERLADSLCEFVKYVPLEDLIYFEEKQYHQRMMYAIYFAPQRSNN